MPNTGGSRPMDPLKTRLARSVQEVIIPLSVIEEIKANPELDVVDIEVQTVSPTETLLRVKTGQHGSRYFHVKFKEML